MKSILFNTRLCIVILTLLVNILLLEMITALGGSSPRFNILQTDAQIGQQCSLVQANCTWNAVDGASSYKITITEVDTNTLIKSDTVQPPTTKYVFPVTQGRTYKCDVSAVSSCGAAGIQGSGQALCQVEGLISSPSATPVPTSAQSSCGYSCQTTADCQSGLVCVISGSGAGYCARQDLQQQCGANPTVNNCCVPPTQPPPPPTLPPTGAAENTVAAGIGIVTMISAGIFLLWKSML